MFELTVCETVLDLLCHLSLHVCLFYLFREWGRLSFVVMFDRQYLSVLLLSTQNPPFELNVFTVSITELMNFFYIFGLVGYIFVL